ncbi:hypothetical protein EIN_282080 [Entamoeba invadens IP1]|uniref:TLDc domain-containing protein n=1 Tax=Entamoeba invadens IP1 TaxID=370355 RepID=A0A0A1TX55_ENTIV|nr:hypothetical protein EIN_282080 [Entamoeba invadens IP1]ELP85837.1 hypothetical protein EIN_282080 [Entamoeba invadens IP1]|eukprot:XP_004185183.1 hypothetical protein EIN_282080 [Entamoeba invadens IP1]
MEVRKKETMDTSDDLFFEIVPSADKKDESSSIFYSHRQISELNSNTSPSRLQSPAPSEGIVINMVNKGTINLVGSIKLNTVGDDVVPNLSKNSKSHNSQSCEKLSPIPRKRDFTHSSSKKWLEALTVESDSEITTERTGTGDSFENYLVERVPLKNRHLKKLKEWTGAHKFKIVMNSEIDGFSPDVLTRRVEGKKNIMLLCVSEAGWVFGCFTTTAVSNNQKTHSPNDKNFFVFSLVNPHHTTAIKITPKQIEPSKLTIFPSESHWIFAVQDAFYISVFPNQSYIDKNIEQTFRIPSIVGKELLTGNCAPDTFTTTKMYALEWV